MQTPDDGKRQTDDNEVEEQSGDSGTVEDWSDRQTNPAWDVLIPDVVEWSALKEAYHQDATTHPNDQAANELAGDAESVDRENTVVEKEYGDLGHDEGDGVGEPTADVAL